MKEVKKLKLKTNLFLVLLDLVVIVALNFIMPVVQNYPPFSENNAFQKSIEALTHIEQYFILFVAGALAHVISLNIMMKDVYKYLEKQIKGEDIPTEQTLKIRDKMARIPYKFYLVQMLIILVIGFIPTVIIISDVLAILKFFLMLFAVTAVIEIVQFVYLQNLSRKIIVKTYEKDITYNKNVGGRIKLSDNILMQVIPFLAVSIILISLIGYSKSTDEKANANYNYYRKALENVNTTNISEASLISQLDNISLNNETDYCFVIKNNDIKYLSNNEETVSDFTIKYINEFYEKTDGRSYEFYGTEKQFYMKKLVEGQDTWYVGFGYYTRNDSLMIYYLVLMGISTVVYLVILKLWSKSLAQGISDVADNLKNILKEEQIDKNKIIPITSNNEIGDLSYYYNKIQDKLLDQQKIIQKQSELTVLGELAGGMAHDINTPMSALRNWIEILKRKDNDEETQEQLESMSRCANHVLEIVNSLRDQIRNIGDTNKENIVLKDVVENVIIMTANECMKNGCTVNIKMDKDIKIYGEANKLTQVLINFIVNSAQAYGGKIPNANIYLEAKEHEDVVKITIKDNAGGLSPEIENSIFKEILTTKGTKGTGIGMYMAYTIIKGCFNGDIEFENKIGKGVKFIINIPKEENKNEKV